MVAAFLGHNTEEAVSICRYPVETPFAAFKPAGCEQFIVAVSILSVAVLVAAGIALKTSKQSVYNFISTGIAASLLLNALVPHVLIAIYTLHYTPGLVSAIALILPLSLLLLVKNKPRFRSNQQFYRNIAYFMIIAYLIFALSLMVARCSVGT